MSETALAALQKFLDEEDKKNGVVRVPPPRDFVPCSFCGGGLACLNVGGCMACFSKREAKKKELDAEYKRQFPDGPKPIFTADLTTPEGIESAKRVIGKEAIEKAFGEGGGGVQEIMDNIERENNRRQNEQA